MELRLTYNEKANRNVNAAFVRGTSVVAWLHEMNAWNIALDGIECFIMPESIRSISAAGIFVVFNPGVIPELNRLKNPYTLIGGKLFIPFHSELQPGITNAELQTLLIWDYYVFHPSIGLVSFEAKNKTELIDLLDCDAARETKWENAHQGIPSLPALTRISIKQKTAEDILKSFKESVGTKPITDIPDKENTTPLKKSLNTAGRGLLKVGLFITGALSASAGDVNAGSNTGRNINTASESNGLFKQFHNWMNKTLEELEKERDTELKRLLTMFDHDSDEALAYAIPLNSAYMQRGEAAPSSRLIRGNTNFSLGRLGGGGNVDSWDASRYYADLRNKYQLSAKKALDEGNHKKAAYVHAHLLGDFSSAANVLVQGKYYREAAALYKDHLKNVSAAAECLENGGLLLEAIDLYKTLQREEKIGDLYKKLGQQENAEIFYNSCIDKSLSNDNYIEAARVIDEKLEQHTKARETLLDGWNNSGHSENCLSRYFELAGYSDESITKEIQSVYTNYTPKSKRTNFLNVLAPVFKTQNEESRELIRGIAYEIASEQALDGNSSGVQLLRNFIPGDKLLSSDTSRFIYSKKSLTKLNGPIAAHQLTASNWFSAITWRNQFITFGTSERNGYVRLGLARGNWEEFWSSNKEVLPVYHLWDEKLYDHFTLLVVGDPHFSKYVVLHSQGEFFLSQKVLGNDLKYDTAIIFRNPKWLPKALVAMAICGNDKLAVLYTENNLTQLAFYEIQNGSLINSFGCLNEENKAYCLVPQEATEMIFRNNFLYISYGTFLMRISSTGQTETCNLNALTYSVTASDHDTELRIIVSTDQGCVLIRPDFSRMNVVTGFTEDEMEVNKVKFIPDNKVVATGGKRAVVYDILPNELKKRFTIETENPIMAILPTTRKNFCALLDAAGKISIHSIEN